MDELNFLRKLRLDFNLSQNEIATIAGVSQGYVSKIESNLFSPKAWFLSKLRKELNISIDEMIDSDLLDDIYE